MIEVLAHDGRRLGRGHAFDADCWCAKCVGDKATAWMNEYWKRRLKGSSITAAMQDGTLVVTARTYRQANDKGQASPLFAFYVGDGADRYRVDSEGLHVFAAVHESGEVDVSSVSKYSDEFTLAPGWKVERFRLVSEAKHEKHEYDNPPHC